LYFLGHIGLGYISAYIVWRFTGEDFSTPLVIFCSLLPDLDILIPFLPHRGPTHSLVIPLVLLLPISLWFRSGLPYLFSFLSHSLFGDLFTGYRGRTKGMYLWPISQRWLDFGIVLDMRSKSEYLIELVLFGLMIMLYIYKRLFVRNIKF
jgi:hypothetical protein